MKLTLICFGDSNTAGFDPRDYFGSPYPNVWCDLLGRILGCSVRNLGQNGRSFPISAPECRLLSAELRQTADAELLIMLGTNDILRGTSHQWAASQMHSFLELLKNDFPSLSPVLLSPPKIELPEYRSEIHALAVAYSRIAQDCGLRFLDIQSLPISIAFDGIHLTQEGHYLLAGAVASALYS